MSLSSILKGAVAAAPAFALAFNVANANAATVQMGCQPAATVKAALAKDSQEPLIVAKRITDGHPVNIFTSNPKGSLGYFIEVKDTGNPAQKQMCVNTSYMDVKLNDPSNPNIPPYIPVETVATTKTDLKKIYQNQGRVIFSAQMFQGQPDGSRALGDVLAVVAMPDRLGGLLAIDKSGKASSMTPFQDLTRNESVNLASSGGGSGTTLAAAGGPALNAK